MDDQQIYNKGGDDSDVEKYAEMNGADNLPPEDEFGDVSVFSDERLAKLKKEADRLYLVMESAVKKSDSAIDGFKVWAETALKNEQDFYQASKDYLTELMKIKDETYKPKF